MSGESFVSKGNHDFPSFFVCFFLLRKYFSSVFVLEWFSTCRFPFVLPLWLGALVLGPSSHFLCLQTIIQIDLKHFETKKGCFYNVFTVSPIGCKAVAVLVFCLSSLFGSVFEAMWPSWSFAGISALFAS